MRRFFIQLDPDEEVLGLVRRSLISESHRILLAFLWVLLPFFFFFPLIRLGLFGIVFGIGLAGSGMVYAARRWKMWMNTVLMITDRRIFDIDQIGFTKREVAELALAEVSQSSAKKQGMFQRMFDIGSVRVETVKALSYDLEMEGVKSPMHVAELINEVQYIVERGSSDTFHAAKQKQS